MATNFNNAPRPFLRWSGGKRRLLPQMLALRPLNMNRYFEPFVGAGCFFFCVESKDAHISDINIELVRAYQAIKSDPKGVGEYLHSIPHTEDAYYKIRAVDPSGLSDQAAAARFIFLMKSCFNGVYRENKLGKFNTPWGGRVYKLPSLSELVAIQELLENTSISSCDFRDSTRNARKGDFVYLDPPYPQTRYRGEYGRQFSRDDLVDLIRQCHLLSEKGVKVMLSYIDDSFVVDNLKQWNITRASPIRSVAQSGRSRGRVTEILVTNY